jgi:hypothetical protein
MTIRSRLRYFRDAVVGMAKIMWAFLTGKMP